MEQYEQELKLCHVTDPEEGFDRIREMFGRVKKERSLEICKVKAKLERAFAFMEKAFGNDQEMILFVTGLTENRRISSFIGNHGCDPYFRYSEKLLFGREEKKLLEECRKIVEEESMES